MKKFVIRNHFLFYIVEFLVFYFFHHRLSAKDMGARERGGCEDKIGIKKRGTESL
jgi:hypothetical protein